MCCLWLVLCAVLVVVFECGWLFVFVVCCVCVFVDVCCVWVSVCCVLCLFFLMFVDVVV